MLVDTKVRPLRRDQKKALAEYLNGTRGIRSTAKILDCYPSGVRSVIVTLTRRAIQNGEMDAETIIKAYVRP